jgi:hypothetical protein
MLSGTSGMGRLPCFGKTLGNNGRSWVRRNGPLTSALRPIGQDDKSGRLLEGRLPGRYVVPVARGLGRPQLGAKRESKSFAGRIGEAENSHNRRRGHPKVGTQTKRHLQHTRSIPAQGSLRPPPQHAIMEQALES